MQQKTQGRRLTVLQKQEMRDLFSEGYALNFIARKFDCRPVAVWNNVFDISPPSVFSKVKICTAMMHSKVSVNDVMKIRSKVRKGITSTEVSRIYGISRSAALGIIRGKTFRWVPGWTRPTTDSLVYIDPIEFPEETKKTDLIRGCKAGTKRSVKPGVLLDLAKKHGVSTSTICRWRDKGKIKIKT